MPSPSVLISGAGIAGATLAYWLGRSGFRPTVVERAPQLQTGGYVIDFWGLCYDIAEKMGLPPELRKIGYDIRESRLVDAHGRKVGGFDAGVFRALTEDRFLNLRRGDLAKDEKQEAARRFARSFAPKTALGVFVRNQATKAFAIPGMAKLALASSVADKQQLPSYDWLSATR